MLLSEDKISDLESRLGYKFSSHEFLHEALTHSSAFGGVKGSQPDYERLEFLGDRVLGLCVSELLFRSFPDESEGASIGSAMHTLVSGRMCAEIAVELGLSDFIYRGSEVIFIGQS